MRHLRTAVPMALVGWLAACGGPMEEAREVATTASALDCAALSREVHHRIRPTNGDSLYTLNANEAANAATTWGYTDNRGVAFRAAPSTGTGLSPVYRIYSPSRAEHFWTIDEAERNDLMQNGGYTTDENVGFYASKTPAACLVPVYRFSNTALRKHRFAITEAQRNELTAAGWVSQGIKFYAAPESTPPVDTKFTFAVIPDTQNEVLTTPATRLDHRLRWLVDNRSTLDLRFVLHTGDVVNWDTPDHIQYVRASESTEILDTAGIPYVYAIGNHDTAAVCPGGSACPGNVNANLRDTSTFNAYFPLSRFTALAGVYEAGKIDNSYHTFSAGGLDWLVLNLELWARTGAVDWAKTVLAQHPRHNVIINTHSHLTGGGTIEPRNGGYGNNSPQYVFDQLIKQYANVRFVFSGHTGNAAYLASTGVHGNTIHQILTAYHENTSNLTRLVEVDTAANTFSTRVYSPMTNAEKQDGSKFTISHVSWVR